MKILKIIITVTITALVVGGCNGRDQHNDLKGTERTQATVCFEKSSEQVVASSADVGDYKLHEIAPVIKNGTTVALLTINQIQRLGIFDWTSSEAVDSGIKYSYTINFKMEYPKELKNGESITFYLYPKLIDANNEIIGNPCIVGWSGFPDTAVFTASATETWLECGVQPIKSYKKATALVLDISDSYGNVYDSIMFSKDVILDADEGPSLLTGDATAKVTGASGAKLTIGIKNVHLEECFDRAYEFKWESDVEEAEKIPTLMFNYSISYDSKPTKNIEVSNIDTSTKESLLYTDFKIGAQSNVGNTMYYDRNVNLTRFAFSDSLALEKFVSATRYKIHAGTKAVYCENREVSDAVINSSDSIRFQVEFNSDALALPPDQLMKFNGRFIVFDKKITSRKPKKESSGKRPYAVYTTDKEKET